MAFNPYNPFNFGGFPATYQSPQLPQLQQQSGLIRATETEAYNYPMVPGATMMFTDGQRIYVKTMDNSPTGGFRFERFVREEPLQPKQEEYLTKAEFEAYKASLKGAEVIVDE